jgi:hypothetical protein
LHLFGAELQAVNSNMLKIIRYFICTLSSLDKLKYN